MKCSWKTLERAELRRDKINLREIMPAEQIHKINIILLVLKEQKFNQVSSSTSQIYKEILTSS